VIVIPEVAWAALENGHQSFVYVIVCQTSNLPHQQERD